MKHIFTFILCCLCAGLYAQQNASNFREPQHIQWIEAGESYVIPTGMYAQIVHVFVKADAYKGEFGEAEFKFCGKKARVPSYERVIMINGAWVAVFEEGDQFPAAVAGSALRRSKLPLTVPAGSKICVSENHPVNAVVIALYPLAPAK